MQIKVTRSKNRQRTISARLVDDVMMVYAPLRIPEDKLEKAIDNLKKRLHKMKARHELNKKKGEDTLFNLKKFLQIQKKYYRE